MNLRILLVLSSFLEILKVGLFQAEVIPESLWEIAKDFPILVIILGTVYYLTKWGERMLEAQRLALKEVYESSQQFLSTILDQMEIRQNKMTDRIELLTQQMAMFGATLGEVSKVDDVIDRLMEKIEAKK